jgi:hypothetical protein
VIDWTIHPANLIELGAFLLAFWKFTANNKRMHEQNIERLQKIETRLEVVYSAFYETFIRRGSHSD